MGWFANQKARHETTHRPTFKELLEQNRMKRSRDPQKAYEAALTWFDEAQLEDAARDKAKAKAAAKLAKKEANAAKKIGGFSLSGYTIRVDGREYSTVDAAAMVESVGGLSTDTEVASRLSATRMVGLGVFALAVPKRKKIETVTDTRELYLTVIGPGFHVVKSINPAYGREAREFAALVNAKSLSTSQ